MGTGELFLPPGFDGVLVWSPLDDRPFLRCLHGYAVCLWRLGRSKEAQLVFERILSLNPNDNQGVRFCSVNVRHGRSWEDGDAVRMRFLQRRYPGRIRHGALHGLLRELKSRAVHIAGIRIDPNGAWMAQIARNLLDPVDGFLREATHLIHDRDPLFTQMWTTLLESGGVKCVPIPAKSPNCNPHAEGS
ncbi:MAG TPA: tetratricopeptide repeat protein [Anaeromyxobacteraceae bacterium]|nr:tetratricopeptide repeat protein [Anaeromyxobacteraceae bacterium]